MGIRPRQIESWQKTMITVCRGYSLGGVGVRGHLTVGSMVTSS
jgi:hypothetical protein